jgi:hypothetical protein
MSGISFLKRLLMKQAMKKSKDVSGIMTLNKNLIGDVDSTVKKWVDSAKRQGQDIDKMGEQELKYLVELNKPKAPSNLAELMEKIGLNDPKKNRFLQKEGEVFDLSGKKIDPGKPILGGKNVPEEKGFSMTIAEGPQKDKKITMDEFFELTGAKNTSNVDVVSDTVTNMKAMTPMDAMKEANLVIARKGKYKNLTIDESQDILKKTNDHIFERDIKYDEFGEIIKPDPEDLAGGGAAGRTSTGLNYLLGEDDQNVRVPFKVGGFNKARRAFLQVMGAGAAGTAAAKSGLFSLLKAGKPITGTVTSVPIGNPAGMPSWFKPLVNKVIKEGDDVTKKFATKEREIVHQVSLEGKIGSPHALGVDDIRVTQSLDDGTIRVQYNTVNSPGEYGVDLIYKKGEVIPTKKGSVKTKEEFSAAEAEPRYTGGPEDADIEWDGENLVNNVDDLLTDTTKLETYATGKKPNIKKRLERERKLNKTKQINESNAEQANYIEEKYGPGPDPSDFDDDDMASGGRVPLAGGKKALTKEQLEEMLNVKKPKHYKESPLAISDDWLKRVKKKLSKAEGGVAGLLGE